MRVVESGEHMNDFIRQIGTGIRVNFVPNLEETEGRIVAYVADDVLVDTLKETATQVREF